MNLSNAWRCSEGRTKPFDPNAIPNATEWSRANQLKNKLRVRLVERERQEKEEREERDGTAKRRRQWEDAHTTLENKRNERLAEIDQRRLIDQQAAAEAFRVGVEGLGERP